jgi:uncharacterized membrane protein YkvI
LAPAIITFGSVFIASTIGLVALIAQGYRAMAYAVIVIFLVPLFTIGISRLATINRRRPSTPKFSGEILD